MLEGDEGEDREHAKRDHLLKHFELDQRERTSMQVAAQTVGGHLQHVLEEGDAPADGDHRE